MRDVAWVTLNRRTTQRNGPSEMQTSPAGQSVDWDDNVPGLSWTGGVHPLNLLDPIGSVTPAQAQVAFHANPNTLDMLAWQ